ncbi:hydantoinase B/oxoprolinase family protein [Sphaerobacter sp.]|uniref:hydantoinase B/oxoprolinase family protein n=1 Tax=Sphaerobacter sp. TaxID=2099654 RepID=UPI001DCB77D4|nr:hydantoinase B/oxoprolinase family protein [Sphaerobacter sp.]MBX5443846.1 hydantoinase B/oxoprolinase family protein [Sphaerobacter sp.]
MTRAETFDPVSLEIMWSRLIGIADDMWTTVLRTAVSTIIGAAQDFGCEILDAEGHSVAHSNRSMPVFNIVMPTVTRAVIERFPVDTMRPGDVFVTNDPWLCAGHLDDIATITPIFHGGRVVAFAVTVAHTSSIGGALARRTVRDIYEEGLRIPLLKLYDAGELNETAWAFIRENVRTADMVLTDIEATLTANDLGARRIVAFLEEYGLPDLVDIARAIQEHSERAMRDAIRALPDGDYEHEVWADGLDEPVRLRCRVTVRGDEITVDYTGSDPERPRGGINCTLTYTKAHTVYPLKCLLSPTVPANEGTFRPFTISAPEGSILNCRVPASVGSRVRTGWHLHSLLFGALERALPDRVQAGNGLMNSVHVYGQEPNGRFYNAHFFIAGGRGASRGRDGIGRNCFPSSARNVPVEVFEARTPVLIHTRELREDSAGRGQWRGAFGHRLEMGVLPGYPAPVSFFIDPDRLHFPPRGLSGGEDGPLTEVLVNGRRLTPEEIGGGQITLSGPDERLVLHIPGGGGYGPPDQRDPSLIEADIRSGLVTPEYART